MSQNAPPPDNEQPRLFTALDLIRHLFLIAPTCTAFYLGLSCTRLLVPDPVSGWICGLMLATIAHFAVLVGFTALARWADRPAGQSEVGEGVPDLKATPQKSVDG